MRSILFLFASLLSLAAFCQDENDLPERESYILKMPLKKNSVYEMEVPVSAYVRENNLVQVYPGETIYLEADWKNDSLLLRSVKENKHPEKTIVLSFSQITEKGKHQSDVEGE